MMDNCVQRQIAPSVKKDERLRVFEWLVLPRQALRVTWASFFIERIRSTSVYCERMSNAARFDLY